VEPRRVYTLSTNQKVHQIVRAVFRPPNYMCELLKDFKTLLQENLPGPHLLIIDLTTYPKKPTIEQTIQYIKAHPNTLLNFISHEADFDLLKNIPKENIFDVLTSPLNLKQAMYLVNRIDMVFSLKEKITHEKKKKNSIIRNLPIPLIVLSSDLTITYMNESARRIFDIEKDVKTDEIPITVLINNILPRDRKIFAEALRRAFSAGLASSIRVELMRNDDTPALIALRIFPSSDDTMSHDTLEVFIAANYEEMFVLDETEVLQKEKLAVLGELSAEIAHEIRNSLMSIGGFVQIMEPEDQKQGKETILSEIKRLERFLTSIREYARPTVSICDVNIGEVINSLLHLMGPELKKHGISYQFSPGEGQVALRTSPDMLKQVVINLIRNACEAMPEGGTLEISIFETEEEIGISISDQGSGIEEPQETLFTPISRGGKSIGLPISHKLAQKLGGSISYTTSVSGTTFTLLLPKQIPEPRKLATERATTAHSHQLQHRPERRSARRFQVSLRADCIAKTRKIQADIVDLSATGLLLKIVGDIREPESLSGIEFEVPSIHTGKTTRISAQVIPVRKDKKNGELLIGCRIEPEERTLPHWNKYIRELHLYNPN